MLEEIKIISFEENYDKKGRLVAIEGMKDIPFEIKRIFYIYGSDDNVIRGCHANRDSEFVLVNINGSSKIKVKNQRQERIFILDKPYRGIYLPKMIWKEMYDFSNNSILLCLASTKYNPNEYITDFGQFVKEIENV
jgi:dTDP-4-dehydrorhamnose 3,5-epimerase-like enzyme